MSLNKTLEAYYYAGAFEAPDPFENKMEWIRAAQAAGFLEGRHPRGVSNALKRMEIQAEEAPKGLLAPPGRWQKLEGDSIAFYPPNRRSFAVSEPTLRAMKRLYSRKGSTINAVCKEFRVSRADFMFLKTQLGWTKDQDEFTADEHLTRSVEELQADRVEESRRLLERAEAWGTQRELERKAAEWDAFERHAQAAREAAQAFTALPVTGATGANLAVLPLADLHIGEGGPEAALQVWSLVQQAVARAKEEAQELLIVFLGDFFHYDTYDGTTTKGTRVHGPEGGENMLTLAYNFVQGLLELAPDATYRVVAGNHDRMGTGHLAMFLASRGYEVGGSPWETAGFQFGDCDLLFHHGDLKRQKAEVLLTEAFSAGQFRSGTRHRYVYSGHYHHQHTRDVSGTVFFQVPTPNPSRGTYERQQGYLGRKGLVLHILSAAKGKTTEFIFYPE